MSYRLVEVFNALSNVTLVNIMRSVECFSAKMKDQMYIVMSKFECLTWVLELKSQVESLNPLAPKTT